MFKLPDGQEIELNSVKHISKVKNYEVGSGLASQELVGFEINCGFKGVFKYTSAYHYSDWGEVKIAVEKVRTQLIEEIIKLNPAFKDH